MRLQAGSNAQQGGFERLCLLSVDRNRESGTGQKDGRSDGTGDAKGDGDAGVRGFDHVLLAVQRCVCVLIRRPCVPEGAPRARRETRLAGLVTLCCLQRCICSVLLSHLILGSGGGGVIAACSRDWVLILGILWCSMLIDFFSLGFYCDMKAGSKIAEHTIARKSRGAAQCVRAVMLILILTSVLFCFAACGVAYGFKRSVMV